MKKTEKTKNNGNKDWSWPTASTIPSDILSNSSRKIISRPALYLSNSY